MRVTVQVCPPTVNTKLAVPEEVGVPDDDKVDVGDADEDLEGRDERDEDNDGAADLVPDDVFDAEEDVSGVFVPLDVRLEEGDEPLERVPVGVIDDDKDGLDVRVDVKDIVDVFVDVADREAVPVREFVEDDVLVGEALGTTSLPPASRRNCLNRRILGLINIVLSSSSPISSSSSPSRCCCFLSSLVCDDPRTRCPFLSRYFQK